MQLMYSSYPETSEHLHGGLGGGKKPLDNI